MKNTLVYIDSRMDASEEKIIEPKDMAKEPTKNEREREQDWGNECIVSKLWDKWTTSCVTGVKQK